MWTLFGKQTGMATINYSRTVISKPIFGGRFLQKAEIISHFVALKWLPIELWFEKLRANKTHSNSIIIANVDQFQLSFSVSLGEKGNVFRQSNRMWNEEARIFMVVFVSLVDHNANYKNGIFIFFYFYWLLWAIGWNVVRKFDWESGAHVNFVCWVTFVGWKFNRES